MIHWGLLVSFLIGAVCAIRLPILHFTLIVIAGILVFACSAAYESSAGIFLWCLAYAALMQIGYVFSNYIFHLIYARAHVRQRRNFSPVMRSKYSPD